MILFKKNKKNQIINWPVKYRFNFFLFLKKTRGTSPKSNRSRIDLTCQGRPDLTTLLPSEREKGRGETCIQCPRPKKKVQLGGDQSDLLSQQHGIGLLVSQD
jgi:hypothetical protein